MVAPVVVYRTRFCPYCVLAARLLERRGIAFREQFLDDDPKRRAELQELTQHLTVPMVFIGERFVGGYRELAALDRSGELSRLVQENA